ncbi:amino acid ABC transporter permease [Haloplasma contractile]
MSSLQADSSFNELLHYINKFIPAALDGLYTTFIIFIITLLISIPLGIIVALCRLSTFKPLSKFTELYIWVMRGTPLLLQLIFVYFGLPELGIKFNRLTAALFAFSLNYAAYFAEIFRAGIASIDKGQYEGAEVLGLSKAQTFKLVVLPQVIKRVLPAIANEVITLVKDTALVYVLAITDLLRTAKIAANRDATLVPYALVGIVYLILVYGFTKLFDRVEKRLAYYE